MRIGRRRNASVRATIAIVGSFALAALGPWLGLRPAGANTASMLKQAKDRLAALERRMTAAEAQRAGLERSLAAMLVKIDASRHQIEATGARLIATEQRRRAVLAQVDAARALVDERAAEAYMDPLGPIDVILGARSYQDLQDRITYIDAVGRSDGALITALSRRVGALAQIGSQLANEREALREAEGRLNVQGSSLTNGLAQQQDLVMQLQREIHDGRALVKRLAKKRDREMALAALRKAQQSVGVPTPPPPPDTTNVQDLIVHDFTPLGGTRVTQALCVADHESSFNSNAVNPASGAAGVFQFLPQVWPGMSQAAGYGGGSVFDPVANVGVAEWDVALFAWADWQADAPYCGL